MISLDLELMVSLKKIILTMSKNLDDLVDRNSKQGFGARLASSSTAPRKRVHATAIAKLT